MLLVKKAILKQECFLWSAKHLFINRKKTNATHLKSFSSFFQMKENVYLHDMWICYTVW